MWLLPGGMHGCSGGHAWLLLGGMRGCSGGCVVAPGGACMVAPGGGVCGIQRDMEIRSMSGQYVSYWNAFLLYVTFVSGKIYIFSLLSRLYS